MSIAGYNALVKEQSSSVSFTGEATTTSDNQTYTITDTAKTIFAYGETLTVKDAGIATTETYTVYPLEGKVTFDTIDAGRVITFDGYYVGLTTVGEAYEFTFDGTLDMGDITAFQSSDREFLPTLLSATASLSKFADTDNFYPNMILDKTTKVIEFYAESTGDPFRFYANVSSDSLSLPVDGLLEESVSFQITNDMVVGV